MSGTVLIAAPVHPVLTEGLEKAGYELLFREQLTQETGMELIALCVGVVTSTRLQLDKAMLDRAINLEFIGRMGSGMEVIDVAYAESKGIRCISSPEGNSNAVAEHGLGLLLSLNKKITKSYNEVKAGQWIRDANRGTEMEGKTIGIIGYGNTGSALARLLSGFDMTVLVYDKYKEIQAEPHIKICKTLCALQEQAHIISLNVPFGADTFHLVDDSFIERMKFPFLLLNTSRGSVVDGRSVLDGLKRGKITGFASDVWEDEPPGKVSAPSRKVFQEILECENTIITPHIAGYSNEALYKMSLLLLERITR